MKIYLYIFLLILPFVVNAQTITTVVGNGVMGDTGDNGPATSAQIHGPGTVNFDSHWNLYISEVSDRVRKVFPTEVIITIGGNGIAGFSGDNGPATIAQLNQPAYAIVDNSGNIFIADCYNNRIRKINTTGIITTIAGNGTGSFGGDGGPATIAQIYSPSGICFDALGNLYIADHANLRIRKVNTSGIISTIAGTGLIGTNGDGGLAIAAGIGGVTGICIDKENNLFMTDGYSRVRKINLSTGIITSVAGTEAVGFSGDGGPATAAQLSGPWYITVDPYGNLFFSDYANNRVRMVNRAGYISTVAGNGMGVYNGDGIDATAAGIYSPRGVAIDSCGNLYIADNGNSRIRKVTYPKCGYLAESELPRSTELSVYPNPAFDQLNVDNLKTRSTYRLLNIVGVTTQQGTLKAGNNSINMQAITNGMYMLELTDNEGKRTVNKISKQ